MDGRDEQHALEYVAKKSQEIACKNNAPHIVVKTPAGWRVYQGCCNSWNCPRCGLIRARKERDDIAMGAQKWIDQGYQLYLMTLTCPGEGYTVEEGEREWYVNSTKFLNAVRNRIKRSGGAWSYACVTERQKRGHPHAHYIVISLPPDASPYKHGEVLPDGRIADGDILWSQFISDQTVRSGLGWVYDVREIDHAGAVISYVTKYLFKSLMVQSFPKGWRRVRYARNWPRRPKQQAGEGFPLLRRSDWKKLGSLGESVRCDVPAVYAHVWAHLAPNMKPDR